MSGLQLVYERFDPVWDGSQYMQPFFWVVTWALIFSFAVAFAMGANDVANSFGTSVGARVLSISQVVILAGLCSFVGAVALGGRTAETIRKGIVDIDRFQDVPHLYMCAMCAALFGTFALVFMATLLSMPVSTTHAIVGAVMGPGLIQFGKNGVDWLGFGKIVSGWFIAPVLAGLIAAGFYTLQKKVVLNECDLEKAFKNQLWFTSGQMGIICFIVLFFIFLEVNHNLPEWMQISEIPNPPTWPGSLVMPLICIGAAVIVTLISRYYFMPKMFRAIERDAVAGAAYIQAMKELAELKEGDTVKIQNTSSVSAQLGHKGSSTDTGEESDNDGTESESGKKSPVQRKKTWVEDLFTLTHDYDDEDFKCDECKNKSLERQRQRLERQRERQMHQDKEDDLEAGSTVDPNQVKKKNPEGTPGEEPDQEDLAAESTSGTEEEGQENDSAKKELLKKKSWMQDLLTLTHDYDHEDYRCPECEKKKQELQKHRRKSKGDLELEEDGGMMRNGDTYSGPAKLEIMDEIDEVKPSTGEQDNLAEDSTTKAVVSPVSEPVCACWKRLKETLWDIFLKEKEEEDKLRNHFKTWWHDLFTLNHEVGTYAADTVRDEKIEKYRECADVYPEEIEIRFKAVQVVSASFMAFSAGANDIANAAGPVAGTIQTFQTATVGTEVQVSPWVLVYTGIAAIIGLAMLGAGVMATVGHNTTKVTPSRGVNIEIGAALAVTVGSILAIPTSATQCVIGAVVAVGLCNKNNKNAVNWSLLLKIFATWVLTPFTSGMVSSGIFALFAAENQVPSDYFPISNTSTAYGQHYPFGTAGV